MAKKTAKGIHRGADRQKRALQPRDSDDQAYARVTKMLGNGRLLCVSTDGIERMGKIRGGMRRSEWISVGDIVLVSLRDFQEKKCDVLMRYTPDEVRTLRKIGELDECMTSGTEHEDNSDGMIVFENDEDDIDGV
jgi:translation initiation factor 1A